MDLVLQLCMNQVQNLLDSQAECSLIPRLSSYTMTTKSYFPSSYGGSLGTRLIRVGYSIHLVLQGGAIWVQYSLDDVNVSQIFMCNWD